MLLLVVCVVISRLLVVVVLFLWTTISCTQSSVTSSITFMASMLQFAYTDFVTQAIKTNSLRACTTSKCVVYLTFTKW